MLERRVISNETKFSWKWTTNVSKGLLTRKYKHKETKTVAEVICRDRKCFFSAFGANGHLQHRQNKLQVLTANLEWKSLFLVVFKSNLGFAFTEKEVFLWFKSWIYVKKKLLLTFCCFVRFFFSGIKERSFQHFKHLFQNL